MVDNLNQWCASHLPKFSVPHVIFFVKMIQKNNLGKVDKKVIKRDYLSAHSP
jgi:acyl-CoA synthetase (AMP-forming)/AMP-acid ligase II